MQRRIIVWCAMVVIVLWGRIAAAAEPSYAFAFAQANYQVAPGGTVDIAVYLKETVGSGTSVLDSNGVGMFGAGVALSFDNPSSTQVKAIFPNAAFNDTVSGRTDITNTTATLLEVTDFSVFVHADNPTPGQGQYLMTIGTFRFMAGSTPGEVTTILTANNPLGDVNITGDLGVLDGAIDNTSATITVIPEPCAFVLIGMAALCFCAARCSRRRRGPG